MKTKAVERQMFGAVARWVVQAQCRTIEGAESWERKYLKNGFRCSLTKAFDPDGKKLWLVWCWVETPKKEVE